MDLELWNFRNLKLKGSVKISIGIESCTIHRAYKRAKRTTPHFFLSRNIFTIYKIGVRYIFFFSWIGHVIGSHLDDTYFFHEKFSWMINDTVKGLIWAKRPHEILIFFEISDFLWRHFVVTSLRNIHYVFLWRFISNILF